MAVDHCAKKLLPWMDGMVEADEKYFKEHGACLLGMPVHARHPLKPFWC